MVYIVMVIVWLIFIAYDEWLIFRRVKHYEWDEIESNNNL